MVIVHHDIELLSLSHSKYTSVKQHQIKVHNRINHYELMVDLIVFCKMPFLTMFTSFLYLLLLLVCFQTQFEHFLLNNKFQ